jgi:hypothetical protein
MGARPHARQEKTSQDRVRTRFALSVCVVASCCRSFTQTS